MAVPMELKFTDSSGEFEEDGVKKNVTTANKIEDTDVETVTKYLSQFRRGGYDKITVTVNLKLPKD